MSSTGPLAEFFSEYPSFFYDSDNSASAEFYRLCDHFKWERNDPDRAEAHAAYKNALTRQFNTNYGTDNDNLASWQSLCQRVGITPIPGTLKGCREAVDATHVNLVDLVDVYDLGSTATHFESVEALSEYTISTGKFFPRDDMDAGDLLKHLLRHIFDPSQNHYHHRGGRGGGRGRGSGRGRKRGSGRGRRG
ncbi:hypothetical protein BJ912DRAFT_908915 [Pholiota molesta]|nr:hypothetical protein BJ912DRAFT_908915 [Pholiota molesta]